MKNIQDENKDKELQESFKKQLKMMFYFNLFHTFIIGLFIIFLYKNTKVLIFLLILIAFIWIYTGIKMLYLHKVNKKMEEDNKEKK